jgi:hypothetical protein
MAEPDYTAEFASKFGGALSEQDAKELGLPPPAPAAAPPAPADAPAAAPTFGGDVYQDPKTGLRYRRVGKNYRLIDDASAVHQEGAPPAAIPAEAAPSSEQSALQDEFAKKFGVDLKNVDKEPPPDPTDIDPQTGVPYAMTAHPWAAHFHNFVGAVIDALPAGHYLRQALDYAAVGDQAPQLEEASAAMAAAHPVEHAIGTGAGIIGSGAALGAAMPELFGGGVLEKAPMAIRAGVSAVANGSLGALDAVANGQDPETAGLVGGVLGGLGPKVGDAIGAAMKSTVVPYVTRLADDAMNRFGIKLGADQVANNPLVKMVAGFESAMPLAKNPAVAQGQRMDQWYRSISKQMGENYQRITSDVIQAAKKRIGGDFDAALSAAPPLQFDQPFAQYWARATGELSDPIYHSMDAPALNRINGLFDKVIDGFRQGGGELQPDMLQQMLRRDNWLDKAANSADPNVSSYARELKDRLEGLFERHAPPDVLKQWQTAKKQWWSMKTVEDAIKNHHDGMFSPEEFYRAVERNADHFASGGGGDLGRLAEIGTTFLKTERKNSWDLLAALKGAGRLAEIAGPAAAGLHLLGPVGTLAAGVPIGLGRLAGWAIRSPKLANRVAQSALGRAPSGAGNAVTRLLGRPPSAAAVARGGYPALVRSAQPLGQNYLSPPMPVGDEASQ